MEAIAIILVLVIWIGIKLSISDLRTTFEKEYDSVSVGISLYENRLYEESIAYFQPKIIRENPSISSFLYLARCHVQLGNYHQAYWNFTRVLNRENNHGYIFFERGEVLQQLEENDLALLDFDKAIWYERNNSEYYYRRGMLRLKLKKKSEANQDFRKAKDMGHENANFYLLQPLLFSDIL